MEPIGMIVSCGRCCFGPRHATCGRRCSSCACVVGLPEEGRHSEPPFHIPWPLCIMSPLCFPHTEGPSKQKALFMGLPRCSVLPPFPLVRPVGDAHAQREPRPRLLTCRIQAQRLFLKARLPRDHASPPRTSPSCL